MTDDPTWNKVLKFLSYRPRSVAEVIRYLDKKKVEKPTQKVILDKLKHFNFINDVDFVHWWVEKRTLVKPKSKRVVFSELIHLGIDRELAQEALNKRGKTEKELTDKLLEKKIAIWRKLDRDSARQKALGYLLRRGFSYEESISAVEKAFNKE